MMEGWKEDRIGNYVGLQQGFALNKKSDHYISAKPTNFPLLKISDLINKTETLFVNENIPKQFLIDESELIYSRTGQVGLIFKGKKGVIYNNCFKIKPSLEIDPNFLFYFLKQSHVREIAQTLATGTAQPDLNHGSFKSIKIIFPVSIITQQKIASILSAYDDLIENNLKRIKLLEEMAQQTYEEWFVRMRFPGYQDAIMNEETGLPEGWSRKNFKEALSFTTGKLDSNALEIDGVYDFYTCAKEVYKTNTYCFDGEAVLLGGNNATGDFSLFYGNSKFDAYQRTYIC